MYRKLLWTILMLVVFGVVMLSSAGVMDASRKFDSPYYYVKHQFMVGILPGLVLMLLLSRFPYKHWRKLAFPLLFVALILSIAVFMPQLGRTINGARSWIYVFGYTFQPSEALKFALIIYLAAWFGTREDRVRNFTYGALPFMVVVGFIGLLHLMQPDTGTLAVVMAIAAGVYFMAGAPIKHLAIIGTISVLVLTLVVAFSPYRLNRIKAMINPSIDPRGISYQLNQSQIAIGSGGVFGLGYGNSRQKLGFLPETVGDSIFAVIGEELGFVGTVGTIGAFLLLCWFMIRTAIQTRDKFGKLIVVGMATWIMSQAFINIAAITGVGPLTGITLPFISFGGTSMATLLASLGVVLNISRD